MLDHSELKIQITLTVRELRELVALVNLAAETLVGGVPPRDVPALVAEVSDMYFELMDNLADGRLGDFEPE